MSDDEIKAIVKQIDDGLKIAEKRMLEEKALRGECVIAFSEDKGIYNIPADKVITKDRCNNN